MKKRIIELNWDENSSEEFFETNANNKQIEKVINDLRKKLPDDYNTDDFVDGIRSLDLNIKRIKITRSFNF
jgi:phenylalanine-4-hydroxylase